MRCSIFVVTFTKLLSFSCLLQKPLKTDCNSNIFAFDRQDVFNACFLTTIVFNITHVAHAIFTFIWMRQLYKKLRIDALASVWCIFSEMTAHSQAICSVSPWSCFTPILYLSLKRGASEAHSEACLSHFRL